MYFRHEQAGPIKRVVQPKFVSQKAVEEKKTVESTIQADTVTASVAASVAVAATAPFLKVSYLVGCSMYVYTVVAIASFLIHQW